MIYNKYFVYKKQVSNDGGQTWADTDPLETTPSGDPIASYSSMSECESVNYKLYVKNANGTSHLIPCDGNSALTRNYTSPYTSMVEAVVGNCVSKLGVIQGNWGCFAECYNLSSITISNSVTIFEEGSFFLNTSLVKMNSDVNCVINLPNQLTTIGDYAFSNCSGITTVNFPNTLTSIGTHAFQWCDSLSGSINIPDSVTSIGESAFYQNATSGVTSVTIGSGITSIGSSAFYSNRNLQSITILATTPPTLHLNPYDYRDDYTFDFTNNCPIYVPADSVNAYKTAQYWTKYASRIQAIPT